MAVAIAPGASTDVSFVSVGWVAGGTGTTGTMILAAAYMPGRSRTPGLSTTTRASSVRVAGSSWNDLNATTPENFSPGSASTDSVTASPMLTSGMSRSKSLTCNHNLPRSATEYGAS